MSMLIEKSKNFFAHAHRPPEQHIFMLAKRIKGARVAAGLTQSALARDCKVTPSAINKLEKGDTKSLSAELLLALSRVLSVSPAWLDTGSGSPSPSLQVTPEEHEMLSIYKLLNESHQQSLLSLGRSLLAGQRGAASATAPFKKLPAKN